MFQQQKRLEKWRQRFVKNGLKTFFFFFCEKAQNFVHFGPFDSVQISIACCQNTYQIVYGETCFSDRAFYVTITDADIRSLKSLHTLFNKQLDHMLVKFEQNRMARKYIILSFLAKNG